jgi:hypothetical protein
MNYFHSDPHRPVAIYSISTNPRQVRTHLAAFVMSRPSTSAVSHPKHQDRLLHPVSSGNPFAHLQSNKNRRDLPCPIRAATRTHRLLHPLGSGICQVVDICHVPSKPPGPLTPPGGLRKSKWDLPDRRHLPRLIQATRAAYFTWLAQENEVGSARPSTFAMSHPNHQAGLSTQSGGRGETHVGTWPVARNTTRPRRLIERLVGPVTN